MARKRKKPLQWRQGFGNVTTVTWDFTSQERERILRVGEGKTRKAMEHVASYISDLNQHKNYAGLNDVPWPLELRFSGEDFDKIELKAKEMLVTKKRLILWAIDQLIKES